MASKSLNNNPSGINQYKDCPKVDDARVEAIIRDYDRRGITGQVQIHDMLLAEHGIKMSTRSICRRRQQYGLKGSGRTTRELPLETKRQYVLDELAKDPTSQRGPKTVKEGIAASHGIHLTREYIRSEMHLHDPEGFSARQPSAKKIKRGVLTSLGPHQEWSGNGHDKLAAIGFPIWGVRDKWGTEWQLLKVLPNNRLKKAIGLMYLKLIKEKGGMSMQMSTDCGSETTEVFGLANALREMFDPDLSIQEVPAHRYLKSIYNITIERGWLRLRLHWGDNVKVFWDAGSALYVKSNVDHYNLVQWLWSTLIQSELDRLLHQFNNHVIRKDRSKQLPSGVSPSVAMAMPHKWGAENCLIKVDTSVIDALIEEIGEDTIQFVTPEYAAHAQMVYDNLGIGQLTFENVWHIFMTMLPLM